MPFADVRDQVHYAATMRATDCLAREGSYIHTKVKDWVQAVTDGVIADCKAISTEFKWMVQVTIMQQNGAGMSSYSSAVMDSTDGLVTATFENEHLIAVVNVFACWCG